MSSPVLKSLFSKGPGNPASSPRLVGTSKEVKKGSSEKSKGKKDKRHGSDKSSQVSPKPAEKVGAVKPGTTYHDGSPVYVGETPRNYPNKFSDLPESVREMLCDASMGLTQADMDKYMVHLWTVCRFLLREKFPKDCKNPPAVTNVKTKPKAPPVRPYALPSQIEYAKSIIVHAEKPIKKQYKLSQKAGTGGFGEVSVAKDLTNKSSKKVAVKKIKHDTPHVQENNHTEIAFLSACKHPNICDFKRALLSQEKKGVQEMYIVMEFLEGGTLQEAAAAFALEENHIAFVAHEVLMALNYLHERQWVHRDLKSANVMLSIKGEVKLIDFGLCADFSEGPRTQMLGSPFWLPPEMIWGHPHSYPADVWSMAVCILELLLGKPAYIESGVKAMFKVATQGLTDKIPSKLSAQGRAFLTRSLTLDQQKRPTVVNLLQDPWVTRPNLNKGIDEVLRQVFLSASFSNLGM